MSWISAIKRKLAADYLKQIGDNQEEANKCAALSIAAEFKLRQLVEMGRERGEIPTATSGRPKKGDTMSPLSEFGLSKKQAFRIWQYTDGDVDDFWQWAQQAEEVYRAAWKRYILGGRELGPLMTSQTNEWYTTPDIIQIAIDVMGGIDLDPCSNSKTEPNVPAKHHLTKEDDGLSLPWFGRVYMNPPYGTALAKWVDKLAIEYESGRVDQAIALTPARPDTRWFRRFRDYPRCFMFGRVKFNDHENSAPFPTMLVNLGCDREGFFEVAGKVGDIYERVRE